MAEAVVDGAPISRFFCHKCTVEIEHLLPDYTCPQCACGFIEELESGGNDSSSGMDISSEDVSDIDIPLREVHNVQRQSLDLLTLSILHGFNALQQTRTDSIGQLGNTGGGMRTRRLHFRPRTRNQENRQNSNLGYGLSRDDVGPTIDSLIQDFILQRYPMMHVRPSPVLFLGNPGDYVWGRDGLDAIVTQLLNQMDGTGPPPLPRKQIDEIPTTLVSKTQVDCKLQCSVCWEDFLLAEPVRLLPCQHVYHELCIVPWLELHGTCPICRQSLGDQNSAEANQDTVGPSLAALFRAANESSSSRPESTSSVISDSSDD